MSNPRTSDDKIWFAHALRGVAALLVVYLHLCVFFWTANELVPQLTGVKQLKSLPTRLMTVEVYIPLEQHELSFGALGVGLFFLLSGFVIPISLERYTPRTFLL